MKIILITTILLLLAVRTRICRGNQPFGHTQSQSIFREQSQFGSVDQQNSNNKIDLMLLTLMKYKIQASNTLCQELDMIKCGKTCCRREFKQYQRIRYQFQSQKSQGKDSISNMTIYPPYSELELCERTGENVCGETCCLSGYCDIEKSQKNKKENLKQVKEKCLGVKSLEELCSNAGLLWCDGTCCGFTSPTHKCVTINHYGIPYIRCPIESL